MDNKQETTLVLVDFSAAFDTINHDILIRRLCLSYGFVVVQLLCRRMSRKALSLDHCSFHCTSNLLATLFGPMDYSSTIMLTIYSHFDLNPSALVVVV